jgi:antitoxin CcdA
MRMTVHTPTPKAKKAVNLSVDAGLLQQARANGLNLSALFERALAEHAAKLWLAENREAIEAYNASVRANGVWSDGWRRW